MDRAIPICLNKRTELTVKDGWTDPNYRKAPVLNISITEIPSSFFHYLITKLMFNRLDSLLNLYYDII